MEELRRNAPAVAAIYEHAKYVNDSDDALVVAFAPGDFLADRGMQGSSVRELEIVVRRVLGPNVAVELRLEEREGESLAHKGERERAERREEARRAITEDPGVRALVERFNATIRDVKPSS